MSSRSSFSIRKLLRSPGRQSLVVNNAQDGQHRLRRHSRGSASSIWHSNKSKNDINDEAESRLDQDEVERIKTIVAAAAAAAANNLKFRLGEHRSCDQADRAHSDKMTRAMITADEEEEEEHHAPRRKPRPALKPILVLQPSTQGSSLEVAEPQQQQQLGTEKERAPRQTPQLYRRGQEYLTIKTEQHYLPDTPPSSVLSSASSLCSCESQAVQCHHQSDSLEAAANGMGSLCSLNNSSSDNHTVSSPSLEMVEIRSKSAGLSSSYSFFPYPFTPPPSSKRILAPNLLADPPAPPPRKSSLSYARHQVAEKSEETSTFQSTLHISRSLRPQPNETEDSAAGLDLSRTACVGSRYKNADGEEVSRVISSSEGPRIDLRDALLTQPEESVWWCQEGYRLPVAGRQDCSTPSMDSHFPRKLHDGQSHGIEEEIAAAFSSFDLDDLVLENTHFDSSISPTFMRPRRAPSPLFGSGLPSATMATSPAPGDKFAAFGASNPSPRRQTRFLPLRLKSPGVARSPSVTTSGVQRKRSQKKKMRAWERIGHRNAHSIPPIPLSLSSQILNGHGSHRNTSSFVSGGSGSRWTLPDNVAELFNGRLFNRMEVNETLSFEKLQAMRESRALMEKQKREKEQRQYLQDMLDAETKAEEELGEEAGDDLESESQLQMELEIRREAHSELGVQLYQTQELKTDYSLSPPQRQPPAIPLPPPPHIATQYTWSLPNTPDTSDTPVNPFHLDDLPSRIGAAGVRVSILLPVKEEEAYFASAAAQKKERQKEEQWQNEEEEPVAVVDTVPDAECPAQRREMIDEKEENIASPVPLLPRKNPLRFTQNNKEYGNGNGNGNSNNLMAIPQLKVTDIHNESHQAVIPKTPASSTRTLRPPLPSSSLFVRQCREDDEHVYLPATPFSLVMPTYRHGPVRLVKPEASEQQQLNRQDGTPRLGVDDTLDWTAFQMAILGGAGDFFSDSVDYGRSSADADEADMLISWFSSLGLRHEQLLAGETDEERSLAYLSHRANQSSTDIRASVCTVGTTASSIYGGVGVYGSVYGIVGTGTASSSAASAAVASSATLVLPPAHVAELRASRTPPPRPSSSGLPPPQISELRASRTPPPRPSSSTGLPPPQFSELAAEERRLRTRASVASYDSLPQSPMADLVTMRGADGKDYVAPPMGYNLGHDLGDFLRWETENVCAMALLE